MHAYIKVHSLLLPLPLGNWSMLKALAAIHLVDSCTCVPGGVAGASGSLNLTRAMGRA